MWKMAKVQVEGIDYAFRKLRLRKSNPLMYFFLIKKSNIFLLIVKFDANNNVESLLIFKFQDFWSQITDFQTEVNLQLRFY